MHKNRNMSRPSHTYQVLTWVLSIGGLLWFLSAFFLAKRSLPHTSECQEACTLLKESLGLEASECQILQQKGLILLLSSSPSSHQQRESHRDGCWMNRKVDSLVWLVVDALRFDFALYDLPRSLGKRLEQRKKQNENSNNNSNQNGQLFQFVADPPTVTMQRLKALTTGGLPTFADFSNNMGGASVEDDAWPRQLNSSPWQHRGLSGPAQAAFVGDDTWVDLYPMEFTTALPFPSFNTRDLDTVDNGCLKHIPDLMDHLRGISTTTTTATATNTPEYEVLVVHFLGVDHVGHTYGPHNIHMDTKLRQMDAALAEILDRLDASEKCHTTLIMGDHGMTPDGNHGGGTEEETHAALFVHTSPGCDRKTSTTTTATTNHPDWHLEYFRRSELVQEEFGQINQIDLVPTISLLLGLPIPYANLGSLVPSFLPGTSTAEAATGLALNAAQVWRYFSVYSHTANRLPYLDELRGDLEVAVGVYRKAFQSEDVEESEDLFLQAARLLKDFLHQALALGQRVWTRFDAFGMTVGIIVLTIGLLMQTFPLLSVVSKSGLGRIWRVEDLVAALFSIFTCGALTFSNSYILEEEHIFMYVLGILSTIIALRIREQPVQATIWRGVSLVPLASRASASLVTGHGLDPSLRVHTAHHSFAFMSSAIILIGCRWLLNEIRLTRDRWQALLDCAILTSIGVSWWEKRQPDPERNGFLACRIALVLWSIGLMKLTFQGVQSIVQQQKDSNHNNTYLLEWVIKLLIATATVTGPSTATTVVLFSFQMAIIFMLSRWDSTLSVSSGTLAALWRFLVRHAFFSTSHACTLNRLQYSAAFIATSEFNFATGGLSLFLNTFGWEIVGLLFAYICSRHKDRLDFWRVYGLLQLLEALTSCISVSVLRRHLMVWDIYAPHFLFVSVFTLISGAGNLSLSS